MWFEIVSLVFYVIVLLALWGMSSFLIRLGQAVSNMQNVPLAPHTSGEEEETGLVDIDNTHHVPT